MLERETDVWGGSEGGATTQAVAGLAGAIVRAGMRLGTEAVAVERPRMVAADPSRSSCSAHAAHRSAIQVSRWPTQPAERSVDETRALV